MTTDDPTALARVDLIRVLPQDTTVEHPAAFRYRVELAVALVFLIMIVNLKGVRESGW